MRILIAFDKFKGSLDAGRACDIASAKLAELGDFKLVKAPLTDGGEGFAKILAEHAGGTIQSHRVTGPLGQPVEGRIGWLPLENLSATTRQKLDFPVAEGQLAIVEMASASGYEQVPENARDPWKTTSLGTGELIRHAAKEGASAILLGIGGSATNDCGTGALEGMGVIYYDRDLQPIKTITPETWKNLGSLGGTTHLDPYFPPIRIACDVNNPLLGDQGATRVFGPQKGLLESDTDRMERLMRKIASRILGLFGYPVEEWENRMQEPGSGAAGGIGFALRAALNDVRFINGFELVSDWLNIASHLKVADWVITGEGRVDDSSLHGKGPVAILRMGEKSKSVAMLAGSIDKDTEKKLHKEFEHLTCIPISSEDEPLEVALSRTGENLERTLEKLVRDHF